MFPKMVKELKKKAGNIKKKRRSVAAMKKKIEGVVQQAQIDARFVIIELTYACPPAKMIDLNDVDDCLCCRKEFLTTHAPDAVVCPEC